MTVQRYSTAGLAHSAAETLTDQTGVPHGMLFWPRSLRDPQPFIVKTMAEIHIIERKAS